MSARFSAIVLAGGASARMGRTKADLPFGAETMLARIVRELAREFDDIVIVAAPSDQDSERPPLAGVTTIHDETAYGGPLDALARGLRAAAHPVAFACSCDLPLIDASVARKICEMAADDEDAVIPRVDGIDQPLHAAWRTRCAGILSEMHRAGYRRITQAFPKIRARIVDESELRKISPTLVSFLNVNTPEEYDRALKLAGLK